MIIGLVLLVPVCGAAQMSLVDDRADCLTDEHERLLEKEARDLGDFYDMDLVIVTARDTGGKSTVDFADDYFDDHGYGAGPENSGILFLIDLEHREVYISTAGTAVSYLTDQRIESILDAVFDGGLPEGDYYGATRAFLSATAGYLQAGIPENQYTEEEQGPNRLTWPESLLGLLLSGLSALVFYVKTRARYRAEPQNPVFEFRKNSALHFSDVQDNLVKTFVTTRLISNQVQRTGGLGSGSGRSTVHRSGSGRMHGGGGRKF
jgi:uncharacterized protein